MLQEVEPELLAVTSALRVQLLKSLDGVFQALGEIGNT